MTGQRGRRWKGRKRKFNARGSWWRGSMGGGGIFWGM